MGFDLKAYGTLRTEIEDGHGSTAAVIHRAVPLGWRAEWDREAAGLRKSMPAVPEPPANDADADALASYMEAADGFSVEMAAFERRAREVKVRVFRRLLLDVVIDFEGVTLNGAEATVAQVVEALAGAGGEYDRGQPLVDLGQAVIDTARIDPPAEKG